MNQKSSEHNIRKYTGTHFFLFFRLKNKTNKTALIYKKNTLKWKSILTIKLYRKRHFIEHINFAEIFDSTVKLFSLFLFSKFNKISPFSYSDLLLVISIRLNEHKSNQNTDFKFVHFLFSSIFLFLTLSLSLFSIQHFPFSVWFIKIYLIFQVSHEFESNL